MAVFGIDISKHQGNIDFDRIVNEGVRFTILRAAYWTSKDVKFDDYYYQAKARNLGVGAYVYSMAENLEEARREANNLLTILQGKQFEYPIYIDMEDKVQKALPKRLLTDIALTFERILKAHKYVPGIYASKSFFSDYLYDNELRGLEHWVAQWSTRCTYQGPYGMWQFGGETNLIRSKYIAGQVVDQDYAYNDYPSFMKKYGYNGFDAGPGPEPPPEPPTPIPPTPHGDLNGPPAPPSKKPIAPAKKPQPVPEPMPDIRYQVKDGDTLWGIAQHFHINYLKLAKYNGIKNPDLIFTGQIILIPRRWG